MAEYPTYAYRPTSAGEPLLRTVSSRRARLFAAGTFFRARDPGQAGNLLSVTIVDYGGDPREGYCLVTNYALSTSENVATPPGVSVELLKLNLKPLQQLVIDSLTTTPAAKIYSISCKIAPPPPVLLETLSLLGLNANLAAKAVVAKLKHDGTPLTPADTITIQQRTRIYPLVPDVSFDIIPQPGWNVAALRAAINADNPWLHMPTRGYDAADGAIFNPISGLVPPVDADVLPLEMSETFLLGGDGMPADPNAERTGPVRSLVFVNYGENDKGELKPVSAVYEWAGENSTQGSWIKYP